MSQSNPYQVNVPLDTRIEGNHPQGYNPLRGLERFLKISLQIYIGLAVLLTLDYIMYQIVGSRILGGETTFTDSLEDEELLQDSIQALVALPMILVYWGCIIGSIRWIMRAHRNLPLLGARGMTITPGWAAGWFFIPIANYWKPYEAMKQLWQASETATKGSPGSSWKSALVPGFMSGWWALWVIANIGGSISYRLGMRAETLEDYLMVGYLDLVVLPLEAIAAVLYLKIIRGITNNQEAASATVVEREGEAPFSSHANSDGNRAKSDSDNGVTAQESKFPSTDGRDFESRFPSSNQEDPYGSRPRE